MKLFVETLGALAVIKHMYKVNGDIFCFLNYTLVISILFIPINIMVPVSIRVCSECWKQQLKVIIIITGYFVLVKT